MQIDLTPEQVEFIRHAVDSGRFPTAADAIREALALWIERERRREEILAAVDAAEASLARGEGLAVTRDSMRQLAEDVNRRARSAPRGAKSPALMPHSLALEAWFLWSRS